MRNIFILVVMFLSFAACGGGTPKPNPGLMPYDAKVGVGKFDKIAVDAKLDETMANRGSKIYVTKCFACHKLTEEKMVAPGWKGLTKRVTAEWIMNYTTNTDAMLNIDPEAQKQLKAFGSRMPNQNLTDQDARDIYEFMRKNDGIK
jgi:mono/diheme cytochrome c family protein